MEKGSTCSEVEQAPLSTSGRGTAVPSEIVAGVKLSADGARVTGDGQQEQPTQLHPCDFW